MAFKLRRSINEVVEIENLAENTRMNSDTILEDDAKSAIENLKADYDKHHHDSKYIKSSLKGQNNGIATLDKDGHVPASQLPSFVDDVLEFETFDTLPTIGETGKIYVTISDSQDGLHKANSTYRWSGTQYTIIGTDLTLGETSSTAYAGDKGKATTDKVNSHMANNSNPHGITKSQVGLSNVPNVTTNNQTPTFTQATARSNITSGDTLSTLFSKIAKWFTDLKTVAFSGSYNDLSNKPTSLPADGGNANTVGGFTVGKNVPSDAKFTDTIYTHPTGDGNLHVPATSTTNSGKVLKAGATAGSLTWEIDKDTITTINGKTGSITKSDIVALGIPAQDTVYTHPSTHSIDMITESTTNKIMTSSERSKLSGIATGAEVNQNAFSHVKVGTTNISADTKTDTVELIAGNGITLTPDATNDKITITGVNQYTHPDTHDATMIVQNSTHRFVSDTEKATWNTKANTTVATSSANGLMSSSDKTNLDSHIVNKSNPHSITKSQIGLGSVDNTADSTKNVLSATKLATGRSISLDGDLSGSATFDGSKNISISAVVADDSHNHIIGNVDGLQTALNAKIDTSKIDNTATTGSLWTSDKIVSFLDSNLPTETVQYNGTVVANTTIKLDIPIATDYKTNAVEVLTHRNSRWEKAIHGIDYAYWFESQSILAIEFLLAGTYIANYSYVAAGEISWTVLNANEPLNQNNGDFWLQKV